MTVQPNKTYESLIRYIARMMRGCGIRLIFSSAGMHLDKQIKKSKSLRGYCQGIPIQCSRRDFYLINRKELTINMDAVLILKSYPVGIGKHIVCIDAGTAAVLQTACRGEPRTPYLFFTKRKGTPKETKLTQVRCQTSCRKRGQN